MKSAATHEFRYGMVNGDGSSLYTSFRYLNGILNKTDDDRLRSIVTDFLHKNKALYHEDLGSGIECKTDRWGDELELEALAMLYQKLIRLVSKTKNAQGKYVTNILNYGQYTQSFKECIYILYDEEKKYYQPLYLINKQNTDEKFTTFQCDDETVSELLAKFIREELHDDSFIQLNCHNIVYENEVPIETNYETEEIFNMIVPNAGMNFPMKRKIPDYADLSFSKRIKEEL